MAAWKASISACACGEIGGLPAATGRTMDFTGTTVLRVVDGKITEVVVQARGEWGGDVQLASGISMQIAMQLEAIPAP